MLTSQRKQLILARLTQTGEIIAKDLSREWAVSEDTIRRDLRELAGTGQLQRVHGGALAASSAVGTVKARRQIASDEKTALGRFGASLVLPGRVTLIDGGTTALQVVEHLPLDLAATIVTHSPEVACALIDHAAVEVIMLGGKLFRHSMVNMGTQTTDAAARIHIDLYIMGATGIHPKAGATTGDFEEAALKRAFQARAAETVVLASSEKLMAASPHLIAPLQSLAAVAMCDDTSAATRDAIANTGVAIHQVARTVETFRRV